MFVVIHLSIAMNLIIKHGILHCTLIKLRQVITFCLLRLKFGLLLQHSSFPLDMSVHTTVLKNSLPVRILTATDKICV